MMVSRREEVKYLNGKTWLGGRGVVWLNTRGRVGGCEISSASVEGHPTDPSSRLVKGQPPWQISSTRKLG